MTTSNLMACKMLLLRNAADNQNLMELIKANQGNAIQWQALNIINNASIDQLQTNEQLKDINIGIFISKNAASLSKPWVDILNQMTVIAIGKGTQQALRDVGVKNIILPNAASSEALLELEQLQQLENKQVMLFKGADGRKLLQRQLRLRGAKVSELELYQRSSREMDLNQAHQIKKFTPNWVQITSEASALSLDKANQRFKLFDACKINVLTVSNRLHQKLTKLGYSNIFIANSIYSEDNIELLQKASWKDIK